MRPAFEEFQSHSAGELITGQTDSYFTFGNCPDDHHLFYRAENAVRQNAT